MNAPCPELEVLFTELAEGGGPALEHAQACAACAAILAEHQGLERELFRLSDPFPPSNFVHQVMTRVSEAPVPLRREVGAGLAILAACLGLGTAAFIAHAGSLGHAGMVAADVARTLVGGVTGFGQGLFTLWAHAAIPLAVLLCSLLLITLFGLKKLVGVSAPTADLKVAS